MGNIIDTFKGNFRQELTNIIQNMTPYSTRDMVDMIEIDNPKFRDFYTKGSRREEILTKHSIAQGNPYGNQPPMGSFSVDDDFHAFMYANVDPDKIKRLREYRLIAAYDIVSAALDEICDEFIVKNERDEIFNFTIKNNKNIDKQALKTLEDEFLKFVQHFDFENKGWEYLRSILMDGELFFEHIVHEEYPEKGILGVVSIPTESIDPIYNNVQNLITKGYLLRKHIFDPQTKRVQEIRPIIFDKNQVSYFHSHEWNENKTFRVPLMEKARRAYKQLSMIEDSIVIHRIVRAPERLIFKIDVGNMPAVNAERHIAQIAQRYWTKKSYDSRSGGVNMFNPQSMLDAFWFPKRAGSEGTSVEQLNSSMSLGETPDLDFFTKKLYKALNTPVGRLASDSTFSDGTEILREELHFARFIIRLQQMFAFTIKETFVTHLKLKGWWDEYDLHEQQLKVAMNEPTHFHVLREQQLFEIRSNNFAAMAQSELVSETYSQKKYLGWNDEEILANREHLRKESNFKWELGQIQQWGPNWRKMAEQEAEGAAADFDPANEGGGPPMGGGGDTPDFGPPPDAGADDDEGTPDDEGSDVQPQQPEPQQPSN